MRGLLLSVLAAIFLAAAAISATWSLDTNSIPYNTDFQGAQGTNSQY